MLYTVPPLKQLASAALVKASRAATAQRRNCSFSLIDRHQTIKHRSLCTTSVMPFSTDTAWPQGLRTIFDICRQQRETLENRYCGPYDKLLNYCFGNSFQYFVARHCPPSYGDPTLRDIVDFEVFLVVFDANRRPVLFAEIKDDGWAHKPYCRFNADEVIRRQYDAMLNDCPLPRLWGLSLLGTSLRIYCGTVATGAMKPNFMPRPDPGCILAPDFLEGAWDIDILSPEGFKKMKEIITDIRTAAAAL